MSRMTSKQMSTPRNHSAPGVRQPAASQPKPQGLQVLTIPKGGEARLRSVAGGVLGSAMDSNYNTVQEVFVQDPGALKIGG